MARVSKSRGAWILGAVAAAVVVGTVATIAVRYHRPAPSLTPVGFVSGAVTFEGGGGAIGRGNALRAERKVPRVDVYEDYACPLCREFALANNRWIEDQVRAGNLTLVMHPVSFLDRSSLGSKWSSTAADAAMCVGAAGPNAFVAMSDELFKIQPEEGTKVAADKLAIAAARSALGRKDSSVEKCISNRAFNPYVSTWTNFDLHHSIDGQTGPLEGTPTILIDHVQFDGPLSDPHMFQSAVRDAARRDGRSADR